MERSGPRDGALRGSVEALLGPTNTGKTHRAIERMLAHKGGVFGLPLRLLAREVYERVVAKRGAEVVALLTGEEKIVPPGARYFICTVEAMPVDRPFPFLAVDEIQLAGHPARGRVFTDRMLHARGTAETLFLGSDTMVPLFARLLPEVRVTSAPRLSTLRHAGVRKLTALPPRSVAVAFSSEDVYAAAERIRRRHGGTAVVLGALSPRARNAQVGLYQSGEVEYVVATDAIGMGLNLDVAHVAFTALRKFDGKSPRALHPAEIGQIAGRAGRFRTDGTFGTTTDVGPFEEDVVQAVESQRFPAVERLFWRNPDLDLRSVDGLLGSLLARPPRPELVRDGDGADQATLEALARDPAFRARASTRDDVTLLWECCQVPDFRKILSSEHTTLVGQLFVHLQDHGRLPEDWLQKQLDRLDRTDGDLDTLTTRLAFVRTWAFVAFRAGWLDDPRHWQARAQAIEEHVSDALHERLTQRFVDGTALHLRKAPERAAHLGPDGVVTVGAKVVGTVEGLTFRSALRSGEPTAKAVLRAVEAELMRRAAALVEANNDRFSADPDGRLRYEGEAVGRLLPGEDAWRPRVALSGHEGLTVAARDAVQQRLQGWVDGQLARAWPEAPDGLSHAGRAVWFRVREGFGSAPGRVARGLPASDRARLTETGHRFTPEAVFTEGSVHPSFLGLRALLVRLSGIFVPFHLSFSDRMADDPALDAETWAKLGYIRDSDGWRRLGA